MPRLGVKSKDYSNFADHEALIKQNVGYEPLETQARIDSNLITAEGQLRAADSIIRNPSVISKTSKVTKQVIHTLIAPAKSVVELLSGVAENVPQAEPVAELFKALLRIELDRQDNDKQIATLYHAMASMLVVLGRMDDVFLGESELRELLDQKLDEIVKILNEFGNFCDVYYKNRTVVRFLKIAKYNEVLEDFAQSFATMKRDLENLISHRATLAVLQTSDTVNTIAADVAQLTQFMNAQTTRERDAQEFVKSKGGLEAIMKDNKLLDEVASKLGDSVNKSIQANRALQYSLHADLEVQLKENQTLFTLKLQCVQDQIEETVNRSTTTILMKLDSGPHEIINDPDIKTIWKDMKWRNSVKSRHFVSAVHHHFEQKFMQHAIDNDGAKHPDTWTLNYLSRVIFYPAIGDAIDEDSSGYVSLHELNHFFDSRPSGWSTPQWLAYWAAGWYKDNLRYRDKIMIRLGVFERSIDGLHAENKEALKEYLATIEGSIKLIVESLYNDILDYFEDDSDEVVEMDALREKHTEYVTGLIEERLSKSKYELDDKRTLDIVIGVGSRLESKIMCILHRLLKRHHRMFGIGKENPLQDGVTVAMTRSFQVVFEAFTKRTRSLMESWRQQRMDVDLQAQWYANGLFEDWYKQEKDQPDENDYDDEELTDEEGGEDDEELLENATRPPTEAGSIVGDEEEEQQQDDQVQGDDEEQADNQENEEEDQGEEEDGQDDAEDEHTKTTHELEVDEKLKKLQNDMAELKGLMRRILRHLEG